MGICSILLNGAERCRALLFYESLVAYIINLFNLDRHRDKIYNR